MGPSERKVAAATPVQYQAAAVPRNLSAAGRDRFSVRRGVPVDGERAGVGGVLLLVIYAGAFYSRFLVHLIA